MAFGEPVFGASMGWVCPKCGTVYAPWVSECRKDHGVNTITVTTPYIQPSDGTAKPFPYLYQYLQHLADR